MGIKYGLNQNLTLSLIGISAANIFKVPSGYTLKYFVFKNYVNAITTIKIGTHLGGTELIDTLDLEPSIINNGVSTVSMNTTFNTLPTNPGTMCYLDGVFAGPIDMYAICEKII